MNKAPVICYACEKPITGPIHDVDDHTYCDKCNRDMDASIAKAEKGAGALLVKVTHLPGGQLNFSFIGRPTDSDLKAIFMANYRHKKGIPMAEAGLPAGATYHGPAAASASRVAAVVRSKPQPSAHANRAGVIMTTSRPTPSWKKPTPTPAATATASAASATAASSGGTGAGSANASSNSAATSAASASASASAPKHGTPATTVTVVGGHAPTHARIASHTVQYKPSSGLLHSSAKSAKPALPIVSESATEIVSANPNSQPASKGGFKFCTECGTPRAFGGSAKFCVNCGHKF